MNILLCVDHSTASQKAVRFTAELLGKASVPDVSVTLFHVAEFLPEYLLSDSPAPGLTSRELAEMWAQRSRALGQKLLDSAKQTLLSAGMAENSVQSKLCTTSCLPEAKKVAAALSIIDEIQSGAYDVVCIGRRGASELASSFIGGVAEKVIRECGGKTVWLVD